MEIITVMKEVKPFWFLPIAAPGCSQLDILRASIESVYMYEAYYGPLPEPVRQEHIRVA